MTDKIQLSATDILPQRPFTYPAHIDNDRRILRYMVDRLWLVLKYADFYDHAQQPLTLSEPAFHRLVFAKDAPLHAQQQLMVVGFFGDRRPTANEALASEFDATLIKEIPDHPGIFSYCTLELDGGNYANMVLFNTPDAKLHWSRSQAHAKAVQKLAPSYYYSVRLHNGVLPQGLPGSEQLRLERVKYFDYRSTPHWRAERILVENTTIHKAEEEGVTRPSRR